MFDWSVAGAFAAAEMWSTPVSRYIEIWSNMFPETPVGNGPTSSEALCCAVETHILICAELPGSRFTTGGPQSFAGQARSSTNYPRLRKSCRRRTRWIPPRHRRFRQSAMRRRTMKYVCVGYYDKGKSDAMLRADKARGIDRQPEMDTSPYRWSSRQGCESRGV
jgi:hypothetical protein